jgi:predicted secreted protein with PEFG-CTERM motif
MVSKGLFILVGMMAISIISVSALSQNAYAASGMSLSADGSGDTIDVSGSTDRSDFDVTITVRASNGNLISVDQLVVSGGSFSTSLNVSMLDGTYTIAANQGDSSKYSVSVNVDVSGGSSDSSVSATTVTVASEAEISTGELNADTTRNELDAFTLTADAIEGATTINVSGTTDRSFDIVLIVKAPNGNVISIDQVTPSGGSYMATISVGGALWSQDGMYTIEADQGIDSGDKFTGQLMQHLYQESTQVEIKDGHVVPEFGTIAIMILVVAIVSIIALSAKTKLSIVPKY